MTAPSPVPSPRDHPDLPESAPAAEQTDQPAPDRPAPWIRRYLGAFSLAGLTGALTCYCLSLTPSLLPRVWYLQAGMSGLTTVIGYGAGVFAGWLARSLIPWRPGPGVRRGGWWALALAAAVLIPLFGVLGAEWQHDIRELTGGGQPSEARYILVVLVALLVAVALLAVARGLRWLTRLVARPLGRFIPRPAATAAAVLVVCVVLGLLAAGVLSRVALNVANSAFGDLDNSTAPGVTEPASALRSGSPTSLVPWPTLGRQGRTFVAGGPTAAGIAGFSGRTATEPIRVYVGLKSASSIAAEAALAVRELDRTGAFDRSVLAVVTTTGTGWINPAMIDPLEYMYDGDTAVTAIQYSYLPSWISFIADKAVAQEAGRDLFDDVYARWLELRPATGPGSWCTGRAWVRSAARARSAAPRTSATGRRGCSGSARPTATRCGSGSSPDATPERRSGCRCTRTARRCISPTPRPT